MLVARNTKSGKFTKAATVDAKVEAVPVASVNQLREEWLMKLARMMQPEMERRTVAHSYPSKFRVSCGFPSKGGELGKKSRVAGQCWSDLASADAHFEILISPVEAEPMTVAAILAHELLHAMCGHKAAHGPVFQRAAKAIGHAAPFTQCKPTDDFKAWVAPMLAELGEYPHASLRAMAAIGQQKKQGTRLLKLECDCCGYTVRTTQKWVAEGMPSCPHGNQLALAE